MAESTDPSCSRYLKRKHDLSEADSIVENFLKSRKNDSSVDQNTHPSSCGSSEDSLKAHMPFAANIINDEDNFVAEMVESSASQPQVPFPASIVEESQYGTTMSDELPDSSYDGTSDELDLKVHGFEDCPVAVYLPLLCLAFKIKYNLSSAAFEDHLRIVQIAANCSVEEIKSASKCCEKYSYLKQEVQKVFVCMNKKCNAILSVGSDGLPEKNQACGHKYSKLDGCCYVLNLPIEEQLKYYLENGGMKEIMSSRASLYDGTTRGDVQSGQLYVDKFQSNPTSTRRVISLQLNVDGAQIFKSSKFSFWPFMGVINESPYRSRRSNMILMSLWYGNKKPPKGAFLDSAVHELKRLQSDGIPFEDSIITVEPIILTTDTMARSVFLDCIQFNGKFGCDFCLHPGEQIKKGKGSTRVYPEPLSNIGSYESRSMEQHQRDLQIVLSTGKSVHGINGPSPLHQIYGFDYVTAQVPDYLHSTCQGAIKFFLGLWTETKHSKELWYLDAEKRSILNDRLLQVRPPYEVTRTSRSISEISFWKASEFRSFALYYFSSLEGLLPPDYYEHFLYFTYGLQVLLQEEVTLEKVKEVDILFRHFVQRAEVLYRKENIRFNLHLLTHLAESVIRWGCLWASSTFIPEWFNGQLVAMANGTQYVAEQMVETFLLRKVVREKVLDIMSEYVLPANVSSLLCSLLHIPDHLNPINIEKNNCTLMPSGIQLLGSPSRQETSFSVEIAIRNYLKSTSLDSISLKSNHSYQRILLPSISSTFTTTSYTRSPKRINDCAFMKNGSFFVIESILYFHSLPLTDQPFLIGRTLGSISNIKCCPPPISDISFSDLPGQSAKLVGLSKSLIAFSANDISKKCVLVLRPADNLHAHSYVATAMPNSVETD